MKEAKEKRTKKLEMKVNPSYISLLSEIAETYRINNVSTLVDMMLNGKSLTRSQSGRDTMKLTGNVASQSTQSIQLVKAVIKNAKVKKKPLAIKEINELRAGFRAMHGEDHADVLEIFQDNVESLAKSIGSIITNGIKYEPDTSKEALRFKRRLSEIDVNFRLPRKRNFYSRHTDATYAKHFKNNGVFKAGERPDAYNRRALKHSLATRAEFMIEHVNPDQFKKAYELLKRWNTINKEINTALLEGASHGITELFKEIAALNKEANQ